MGNNNPLKSHKLSNSIKFISRLSSLEKKREKGNPLQTFEAASSINSVRLSSTKELEI